MNSFLNHKKVLLFTSICIWWSSHHLVFAANDLADSARRAAEVHDAVNAERMNLKKTGFVRWYDESFLHLKLELRELTQYQFMSDSTVSAETSYEEILPLIEALIKYRKIVTNDLRDVPLEEGFKCRDEVVDKSINYINAYMQNKHTFICYSEVNESQRRAHGVLLMIQSILPQEQDPLDFAVEHGIISSQYIEGKVLSNKMNHAELAAISSRIMDYIWNNRQNLEPYQKIELWYDSYFQIMNNGPVKFQYALSSRPSSAVQMWEIYKLLPDLLQYRTGASLYERNSGYICGEKDFIFSNHVYNIHVYLDMVSKECIKLVRYHELNRQEGVELLLKVIFREIVNPELFAVQNGFFSSTYLAGDNKYKPMKNAELAKIIVEMIFFIGKEKGHILQDSSYEGQISPEFAKIGEKVDEFLVTINQKLNQPNIPDKDAAKLRCEYASFMDVAAQFETAFEFMNVEKYKKHYSDECLTQLIFLADQVPRVSAYRFYWDNYQYYEHLQHSPSITLARRIAMYDDEAVKQFIIDQGSSLFDYVTYYFLTRLNNEPNSASVLQELYDKIDQLDSEKAFALTWKAYLYSQNGETEKSLETLLKALTLEKNFVIYYRLALKYTYKCMAKESMKYLALAKSYTKNQYAVQSLILRVKNNLHACEEKDGSIEL